MAGTTMSDRKYMPYFMSTLNNMQNQGQFTDIILVADDVEIPCHKVVLAAATPYFQAMFSSGFSEGSTDKVMLKEIDGVTLTTVVKYIYTSNIEFDVDGVQKLVKACEAFMLTSLKRLCDIFMAHQVNADNCIGMLSFADTYSLKQVGTQARYVMATNFKMVSQSSEFLSLTAQQMTHYISTENVLGFNEDQILVSVLHWANHDIKNRQHDLETLLKITNLSQCSPVSMTNTMTSFNDVLNVPCKQMLLDAITFQFTGIRNNSTDIPADARQKLSRSECLIICGGAKNPNTTYNRHWWKLPVPKAAAGWWISCVKDMTPLASLGVFKACMFQKGLLVVGGHDNEKIPSSNCWYLSPLSMKWIGISPINVARYWHGLCCIGSTAYVVGGQSHGGAILNSLEYLVVCSGKWETGIPIPKLLSYPMCTTYQRKLFVFGGSEGNEMHSLSVFSFDSVWNDWTRHADMPQECRQGAAVTLNDYMYIVGGHNGSCMRYDPSPDQWSVLSSSLVQHACAPATVACGKILVAGGRIKQQGEERRALTIEEYDPLLDQWTIWGQTPTELSSHCMFCSTFKDL